MLGLNKVQKERKRLKKTQKSSKNKQKDSQKDQKTQTCNSKKETNSKFGAILSSKSLNIFEGATQTCSTFFGEKLKIAQDLGGKVCGPLLFSDPSLSLKSLYRQGNQTGSQSRARAKKNAEKRTYLLEMRFFPCGLNSKAMPVTTSTPS